MDSHTTRVERESLRNGELVRKVIMVVMIVAMLGYAMMWVILPTPIFSHTWAPNLKAKLNSIYFGIQGRLLLVFTFPVLFVAVLGSIYLHLENKSHLYGLKRREKQKRRLGGWRRPVMVRGPLGIVSAIEVSFFIIFIALLVWSYVNYLHVGYSRLKIQHNGGQRWRAKWEIAVKRLGLTGNICLTFLFFPVTRGSSILPLFGLTSEGCVKYHIWLGHLLLTIITAHGLGYILLWVATGQLFEVLKWNKVGISNVAGEISLLAGIILWAATFPRIRRKMFEVFFYTHHLYILFIFFFFLHVGISYAGYMLPGFYLFILDRYLRFLQSRRLVRLLYARTLPCESLELNFAKNPSLSYTPTSVIFLNVPTISKLQCHPFTITSNSNLDQDRLSVVLKVQGSWTRKLYDMLVASSSSFIDRLEVSVEGPYGPPSPHFLRHDTVVMVSGGSGITPFFSIIRELIYASTALRCQTPKLVLISSFKKSVDLSMLNLLLPLSTTPFDLSNLDLQIKAYVTRETNSQAQQQDNKQPRTIWFKPNASDAPISSNLGSKTTWLWVAAIISSSFVAFLIFLGLMNRYYIYPIDKNTNKIFPAPARTILNILIICVCIVLSAAGAVVWNKKRHATETRQIINMEGITPMATPGCQYYNSDREVQSLPYQSDLLESVQVYYGERPDLKRMLFECKGSSVGVLVSGPHGMRREVAAICASGLADNLHFQSLSFNW